MILNLKFHIPSAALVLGIFLISTPVAAFEHFTGHQKQKAYCQTACHQPERIQQSLMDRTKKSECRQCHVGKGPVKSVSPFDKALTSTTFSKSNRRVRTRSSAQPAAALKVPAKASSASKAPKTPKGMAYVEAGEFIMGSNERWDDESPEHINTTDAYFIDLNEVTNSEYKKFVDATDREAPHHWMKGKLPKGKENHPVIYVSWFDANDYCAWKGKRLPTEEEWEKAARSDDGRIYPWGNVWVLTKSNNPYKGSTGTEPIGSYPEGQSPYGLNDMSGNVWEWVDDYYLPHPGNTIHKPEYGKDKRILKGGSWFDCLSYGCGLSAPTFNRAFFNPEVRNNSFGFRCAQSAKPAGKKSAERKP